MGLGVIADQVIPQPQIGLGLVLRRVEVIERLVRFLDRAERPLDFALRSGGDAPPVRVGLDPTVVSPGAIWEVRTWATPAVFTSPTLYRV